MYSKLILVGNLTRDPEMRYASDGTPVTNFSVATNRRWNDKDGNKQEEVIWWRCTAWRRLAETVNEFLTKGRQVLVEGTIKPGPDGNPRTWTGQDGVVRASYEVTAFVVKFLGSRTDGAPAEARDPGAPSEPPAETEEIPF